MSDDPIYVQVTKTFAFTGRCLLLLVSLHVLLNTQEAFVQMEPWESPNSHNVNHPSPWHTVTMFKMGTEQKNSDFSFYYRTSELDLVADWTDLFLRRLAVMVYKVAYRAVNISLYTIYHLCSLQKNEHWLTRDVFLNLTSGGRDVGHQEDLRMTLVRLNSCI